MYSKQTTMAIDIDYVTTPSRALTIGVVLNDRWDYA